jgi:hypothetical protein
MDSAFRAFFLVQSVPEPQLIQTRAADPLVRLRSHCVADAARGSRCWRARQWCASRSPLDAAPSARSSSPGAQRNVRPLFDGDCVAGAFRPWRSASCGRRRRSVGRAGQARVTTCSQRACRRPTGARAHTHGLGVCKAAAGRAGARAGAANAALCRVVERGARSGSLDQVLGDDQREVGPVLSLKQQQIFPVVVVKEVWPVRRQRLARVSCRIWGLYTRPRRSRRVRAAEHVLHRRARRVAHRRGRRLGEMAALLSASCF